ncbi:MAG: HD domain-containing protein [Candidatus Aenigmatarchaeota archaeon]
MLHYRTGWQIRGIPDVYGETNLMHTKKMIRAVDAYVSNPAVVGLDKKRMHDMVEVHDLPESFIRKDTTPFCGVSKQQKQLIEIASAFCIRTGFPGGEWFYDNFLEYTYQETPESQPIWQLDKMCPTIMVSCLENILPDIMDFYNKYPEMKAVLRKKYPGVADDKLQDAIYKRLQEFAPYTRARLTDPILIKVFDNFMELKEAEKLTDPYEQYYELLKTVS